MPIKCKPIPYQEFSTKQEIIDNTNCLAFVLGINRVKRKTGEFSLEKTDESIEVTFLKKVEELGFDPQRFKVISHKDEKDTYGYIIRVYGFVRKTNYFKKKTYYDYHLMRREPDGQWVHKPGFYYQARLVTQQDWGAIWLKYGGQFVSFSIDEDA